MVGILLRKHWISLSPFFSFTFFETTYMYCNKIYYTFVNSSVWLCVLFILICSMVAVIVDFDLYFSAFAIWHNTESCIQTHTIGTQQVQCCSIANVNTKYTCDESKMKQNKSSSSGAARKKCFFFFFWRVNQKLNYKHTFWRRETKAIYHADIVLYEDTNNTNLVHTQCALCCV